MVLVDSLTGFDAAQNSGRQKELDHSSEGLKHDEGDCEKAENAVWGNKVRMVAFVDLDNGESGEEADDADKLNAVVNACAE